MSRGVVRVCWKVCGGGGIGIGIGVLDGKARCPGLEAVVISGL